MRGKQGCCDVSCSSDSLWEPGARKESVAPSEVEPLAIEYGWKMVNVLTVPPSEMDARKESVLDLVN